MSTTLKETALNAWKLQKRENEQTQRDNDRKTELIADKLFRETFNTKADTIHTNQIWHQDLQFQLRRSIPYHYTLHLVLNTCPHCNNQELSNAIHSLTELGQILANPTTHTNYHKPDCTFNPQKNTKEPGTILLDALIDYISDELSYPL